MSIRAAAGRVEITTDKNIVHDSLFAKVLVMENNDELTALISMDCICLGGEVGQISDRFF